MIRDNLLKELEELTAAELLAAVDLMEGRQPVTAIYRSAAPAFIRAWLNGPLKTDLLTGVCLDKLKDEFPHTFYRLLY